MQSLQQCDVDNLAGMNRATAACRSCCCHKVQHAVPFGVVCPIQNHSLVDAVNTIYGECLVGKAAGHNRAISNRHHHPAQWGPYLHLMHCRRAATASHTGLLLSASGTAVHKEQTRCTWNRYMTQGWEFAANTPNCQFDRNTNSSL